MSESTKYGHLISADEFEEDDVEDEAPESRVEIQHQTVNVIWSDDPDLKYQVVISHGDHDWEPICSHVWRQHRLAESNQFDPMGTVDWTELPRDVQERVVDVVAGVTDVEELDPEQSLGVDLGGDE